MTTVRRHGALLALLALGLALRVVLAWGLFPNAGYASDLGQFREWATALAANGPGRFYETVSSGNYPPGYLYVLWLLGTLDATGLLKLPAILADLGIAVLLYALGTRWRDARTGLVAAGLFLFLPVSWYDSALWGQVDAVGTMVVLAALLLLVDGWSEAALVTAVLAVLVKPQYAIGLAIVLPVLVRRHLLRPGSGPVPVLRSRFARIDAALGGAMRDQGPRRFASSLLIAAVVGIAVILPFDLATYAPASLADVPVISSVAGLIGLFARLGSEFSVLTANAFNPWALVGSPSLASVVGSGSGSWLADTAPGLAGLQPVTVGAGLLVVVGALVAGGLLVRDGLVPIVLGFTILALAFFVLPTRVHERYLFPFFATAALLAAPAASRIAGYVVMSVLGTVNLHAVLAGNLEIGLVGGRGGAGSGPGGLGGAPGGFPGGGGLGVGGRPGGFGGGGGGFGSGFKAIDLPWADIARSEPAVIAVAVGGAVALLVLVTVWIVLIRGPGTAATVALAPVPQAPAAAFDASEASIPSIEDREPLA